MLHESSGTGHEVATAFAAASLLISSTASAAPVRAADYVASASLVSASAQTAVCASGVASVAAGAVAAAQAAPAQPGCVLPVVDEAPTVAVVDPVAPAVYVPPAEGGGGNDILPILLGFAAIAGLAWLLLDNDDEDDVGVPVSPG